MWSSVVKFARYVSMWIHAIVLSHRLWDIECGACLRVLEGHEELVRCIRFDNKRIVSGAYDGWESFFVNEKMILLRHWGALTFNSDTKVPIWSIKKNHKNKLNTRGRWIKIISLKLRKRNVPTLFHC